MKFNVFTVAVSFLALVISGSTMARAFDYIIQDNGAGSQNQLQIENTNSTSVFQTNQGSVNNNVDASANTGGNSVNGSSGNGTINTGDATVNVNITNQLNSNNATVCCGTPTPTLRPGQPTPTKAPVVPTPTQKPGNGGNGDNNGNGGANVNGGNGGGSVMGLAATSGEPLTEYLFYAASFVCLVAARKLLKPSVK